jgi:flagellar FliL protein
MAENEITPGDEESPIEGGGLKSKLKIAAFMFIVVGVECGGLYMFFANGDVSAAQAALQGESTLDAQTDELLGEEEDIQGKIELDLGNFSVTAFQPIEQTTLRIDFQLYGTVLEDDGRDTTALLAEHKHRFREQVIIIVRSAQITDLTDSGLGLIKRKILEKSNRTLGKPLLQGIVFSEFSFVEQ